MEVKVVNVFNFLVDVLNCCVELQRNYIVASVKQTNK